MAKKKAAHIKVVKSKPQKNDSRDKQFHLDITKKNKGAC